MSKVTWLDKLQEQVKIDIDCMDPEEAKRFLPFKPHDQTSNQRLVYEQMISPENHELFLKTAQEGKDEEWEVILDRMSALLCAKNIENIQGRVLLQTSAFHAYDTRKVVAQARSYAREFEKLGISKDRICIKIPCTGPALNASPILLREGIRTLGTSLFSVAQAIAASQAETLSISPYFNFPWYHPNREQWPNAKDPALDHPMSPSNRTNPAHLQAPSRRDCFISACEAVAMAELGCDHATIPEDILLQLSLLDAEASPPPGSDSHMKTGTPSQRLVHLAQVDPLTGPDWPGLPSLDIDYLADNGAALTEAIAADTVTQRGLDEALEAFKANELQSRDAIEEALKQF
ncbi:transaldolase B [Fusarium pseudocircinatum]|uniref:Transaldolase B n=1 Tax=Fusarium pseudocircinatum TaxID=56676 RepID=A0A8H5P2Q8_9HYPO|nr:transaldolase B [Fusarium pseudocircinatum]